MRTLKDNYRGGRIEWTGDDTAGPFRGRELCCGEVIAMPGAQGGGLAVRFAPIDLDGKSTYPVLKLDGKPALLALVEEARRKDEAKAAEQRQQEAELRALPETAFHEGVDRPAGYTFRLRDEFLTVVGYARRRVWDNYEDEWVYRHVAGCRPATDTERAVAEARIATAAEAKRARAELDAIAADIRAHGNSPAGYHSPEGDTVHAGGGERIYGGGRWFVLGPEWTWFVQNNGHDGDDWSQNNVRTGGAGAIGWRVPAEPGLCNRIRHLAVVGYPGD